MIGSDKKPKFLPVLAILGYFLSIHPHVGALFANPNKTVVYQKWQNQVRHYLFKIQIKCKCKVDGVLDPFKSLLPPIFRKYKLKLRKLFVLNDDGDFQHIRRLWSQSAATSGQRLSDCVGSFITLCHHHCIDLIVLSLFQTLFRQCTMG